MALPIPNGGICAACGGKLFRMEKSKSGEVMSGLFVDGRYFIARENGEIVSACKKCGKEHNIAPVIFAVAKRES